MQIFSDLKNYFRSTKRYFDDWNFSCLNAKGTIFGNRLEFISRHIKRIERDDRSHLEFSFPQWFGKWLPRWPPLITRLKHFADEDTQWRLSWAATTPRPTVEGRARLPLTGRNCVSSVNFTQTFKDTFCDH